MRNVVVVLVLAVVAIALPYPSQAAGAANGIAGYFDPTTSRFVPMLTRKALPTDPPVVRTGTVKLDIRLGIESAIGTDEEIYCNASIYADDASFDNFAGSSGIAVRSGATATLTLTIPYEWTQAATGEIADIFLSCYEEYGDVVDHEVSFGEAGFVVPAAPGTITTKNYAGSL